MVGRRSGGSFGALPICLPNTTGAARLTNCSSRCRVVPATAITSAAMASVSNATTPVERSAPPKRTTSKVSADDALCSDSGRSGLVSVRIPDFLAGQTPTRGAAASASATAARSMVVDHVRSRVAQWYAAGAPDVDLQPRSWHLCPSCGVGYAPSTVVTSLALPPEHHRALADAAADRDVDLAAVIRSVAWDLPPQDITALTQQVERLTA